MQKSHPLFQQVGKQYKLPTTAPIISSIFTKSNKDQKNARLFQLYNDKIIYYKAKQRKDPSKIIKFDFDVKFQMKRIQPESTSPSRSPGKKNQSKSKKINKPQGIIFQKYDTNFTIYSNDQKILSKWKQQLCKRLVQRGFHNLFKPIKKIGKGNFASVYLAQRIQDDLKFAVKAFSKQAVFEQDKDIMRKLNHPNLMGIYQVFQSDNSIYLVVQLLQGGQLYDPIKDKHKFQDIQTKKIMAGILMGLQHMYNKRIMHRDLKPQNIILRKQGSWQAVIADFGLATECDIPQYLYVRCGTPGYVAPQIVNLKDLKSKCDPICDVFSAGLIFHILLTGKSAFPGKTYNQVLSQNRACNFQFQSPQFKKISQKAIDLLKKMLQKQPLKRINPTDALRHSYFQDLVHEIKYRQDYKPELNPYSPSIPQSNAIRKQMLYDDSCLKFHMKESVITGKVTSPQGSPDLSKDSPNIRKIMPMSKFVGVGGQKKSQLSKFGVGKKQQKDKVEKTQQHVNALKEQLKKLNI